MATYPADKSSVIAGIRDPHGEATQVPIEIDPYGPWAVIIPVEHHQRHEGEMFSAKYSDATLADTDTAVLHIKTGASYSHLFWAASAGLAYTVELFRGPTLSNNGTAVTVHNANDNSDKTSTTTAFHTPTVSNNGTSLEGPFYVGGGAQRPGGSNRQDSERILLPNTSYLIVLTSRANSNLGSVVAEWYDEGAD